MKIKQDGMLNFYMNDFKFEFIRQRDNSKKVNSKKRKIIKKETFHRNMFSYFLIFFLKIISGIETGYQKKGKFLYINEQLFKYFNKQTDAHFPKMNQN